MNSKPEDIYSKSHFKKIKNVRGSLPTKSSAKSIAKFKQSRQPFSQNWEGGQHGLLELAMQPATYHTVIGQYFQCLVLPPHASPVPNNADADEIPRYIQLHAAQVDQWCQMVNVEDILKQQLLGSLEEE